MINSPEYFKIDITVFIAANLVHLLCASIFLARIKKLEKIEYVLGIIIIALIIPTLAAAVLNFMNSREWWSYILPVPIILFFIVELVLDYILKLEFRNTNLLWPYLGIFYLGSMGMIGYSFLIGRVFGFVTLFTYFINLFASWYSYSKVGHG